MKHKHYNEIIAWANGETIELYVNDKLGWEVDLKPTWSVFNEYRIEYKEKYVTKYFQKTSTNPITYVEFQPDLEHWDLRIVFAGDYEVEVMLPMYD